MTTLKLVLENHSYDPANTVWGMNVCQVSQSIATDYRRTKLKAKSTGIGEKIVPDVTSIGQICITV